MEAKDTVMPVGRHNEGISCPLCGEEFGIESKVEYEREMQAEISFKAGAIEGYQTGFLDGAKVGRKAGIREVVEWVKDNADLEHGDRDVGLCFEDYLHFEYAKWQAQLKEWGIEKKE